MNADKFTVKAKHDHVIMTFFAGERQVAQVNFAKKPLGFEVLQALQDAIWGETSLAAAAQQQEGVPHESR